ncbi:hypothetical protein G9E11_13470 [Arthrobacter sp. IA7]|nr:hypothetical protein [Arthrobacter ipis]
MWDPKPTNPPACDPKECSEQTGEHIIELLSSLSRDHNTTILVVTHDRTLANKTGPPVPAARAG